MHKFMLWSHRHPVIVIIILLGVSAFFAYYIQQVKTDVSVQSFWMKDDPAKKHYDNYLETFGSDKLTIVYVKVPDLFTPQKLAILSEFQTALEDLPYVNDVDSLFSVSNFKDEDGMLLTDPFIEEVPETIEEAELIKADVFRNPLAVNSLVSADGSVMTFNIFLEDDVDVPDYEVAFSKQLDEEIATIAPYVTEAFQLGNPYTMRTLFDNMLRDQKRVVPLGFILFNVTMFIIWRSLRMQALTLITSGLSIIWTVGFMGLFGIPMTTFTTMVPVLLIVVGSTEDIHLFAEYVAGLQSTGRRNDAIRHMIEKSSIALSLTALTTFLGFLAISLNKIIIIRQFGIVTAFGMLANPLITFMFTPVFLQFLGPQRVSVSTDNASALTNRLFSALSQWITSLITIHKRMVLSVFIGSVIVIGSFSLNLKMDNDILGWFEAASPIVRRVKTLNRQLAGAQTFVIHISSGAPDIFEHPESLAQVEALQEFLRKKDWCDTATSIVDLIKLMNRAMHDGDEAYYRLPDSANLIAQYFLLMPPDDMADYITDDYSEVNIVVRHSVSSSHQLKDILARTQEFIDRQLNPHFLYHITGESILSNSSADSIAAGQMKSVSIILLVIFILMSLLFVNFKAGALSLIPNLLPIILLCGTMGLLGIFLNTATSMVVVIAVGIAVDDTIHFMTRYYREMRRLQDRKKAVAACIRKEIRPIISTSVGLGMGFAALGFSSLVPLVHYGLLSAFVLMVAMAADLLITPIIISSTQLLTLWDMLDLRLKDAVIKLSPLFRNLKGWHIKKVVLLGKMLRKAEGEMLIRRGDEGQSMYLLLEGRLQVAIHGKGTDSTLVVADFGPGEVFGEMALVNPGPRSADIQAMEDVTYLEIDWKSIERIQRIYPRIAMHLYRNLAQIMGQRLKDSQKFML